MNKNDSTQPLAGPTIERLRMEPIRRNLTVKEVQNITPRMLRVRLQGEELAGFRSPSPDDHIKVFFPEQDNSVKMRDYTPRHFDAATLELTLEFYLHDSGVGSDWAQQAKVGDRLQIGGPRGSAVIFAPGAWWLLIGDETALPSVARRLHEFAPGTEVITLIAVAGQVDEQTFETRAKLTSHWLYRPESEAAETGPFVTALSMLRLPPGPGFIWIAAESEVSRALRTYAVDELGHSPEWIKASSYWSTKPEEPGHGHGRGRTLMQI